MTIKKLSIAILFSFSMFVIASCGGGDKKSEGTKDEVKKEKPKSMLPKKVDPMKDLGIGPVKEELVLPAEIDEVLAEKGHVVYKEKCTACHKTTKRSIGPAPLGIFERRNPTWVMNMILNPDEMVEKNAIAKKLLIEYNGSPMANQNLTVDEARSVVEYFRTLKAK